MFDGGTTSRQKQTEQANGGNLSNKKAREMTIERKQDGNTKKIHRYSTCTNYLIRISNPRK